MGTDIEGQETYAKKDIALSNEKSKDSIADVMGEFGKWQVQKILLVFLISVPGLATIFSVPFVFYKTKFECAEPTLDIEGIAVSPLNSINEIKDIHQGNISSQIQNRTFQNGCEVNCNSYGYDRSFWQQSVIMEWDLVCDQSYLLVLGKMTIFGGFAVGTFGAGWLSDAYGRKTAIILLSQLLFGAGILASTMTAFAGFLIFWFLTGIAAIGVYTVCFVWAMEAVSGKWKTVTGIMMAFAWPISSLLMTGIGGTLRDWRRILQVACALHIITPILGNYFPESPRWLLARKSNSHKSELKSTLMKIAKINKRFSDKTEQKIDLILKINNDTEKNEPQSKHDRFIDIFRHRILITRTLIMFWNWFTNAFIIYGLNNNWKELTGNLITNLLIGSALGIVARFITMAVLLKMGRKLPYITCLLGAGLSFLVMLGFEKGVYVHNWPIVICAMFGYFCITSSFGILWIYASELYPTNARNAGVGSCSFVARIGGVLSNLVGQLAETHIAIPTVMFAFSALLSAFLSLFLPETGGRKLPDTIDECKLQSSDGLFEKCCRRSKTSTKQNS